MLPGGIQARGTTGLASWRAGHGGTLRDRWCLGRPYHWPSVSSPDLQAVQPHPAPRLRPRLLP